MNLYDASIYTGEMSPHRNVHIVARNLTHAEKIVWDKYSDAAIEKINMIKTTLLLEGEDK